MSDKRVEAAVYLGITDQVVIERIPDAVVDAVTTDDMGEITPDLIAAGVHELTDQDRDEVLRFRNFLRVARKPPVLSTTHAATAGEHGEE